MWQVTELIPHIPKNIENKAPRLFFALYYKTDDDAFKKAAQTWRDEIKKRYNFSVAIDEFFEKQVTSEKSFKAAWDELYALAAGGHFEVLAGNLLTHASIGDNRNDGLEFSRSDNEDGTLKGILHGFVTDAPGDRREQALLADYRLGAGIHEDERACAIGVLRHPGRIAALAEKRRLLVAGDTGDRDGMGAEEHFRVGVTVHAR